MKCNNKTLVNFIVFFICTAVVAISFSFFLYACSIYPDTRGTDTFGHLFKINYIYECLTNGELYPIYTPYWYNGMELFRYWPPLSYYVVAILQFLTDGRVINAFYLFVGICYVINMVAWYMFGKLEKRLLVAFFVGNLYFFCPDNIRILMSEGNIPRIFIGVLVPYAFYFTWRILEYKDYKKLIGLSIITLLITFTHFMISAMLGVSLFLFAAFYSLFHKAWRQIVFLTIDLGLAYMSSGIFLIPGLTGGGLTSQNSEASVSTVGMWAQEALKSLNPFLRFEVGMGNFYFGLTIFLICCLGIILMNKKTGPLFCTTIFIFVCTTEVVSEVIKLLPLSQVFWMQRFVPMAMCSFFIGLLFWKRLKKSFLGIMCVFMVADSLLAAYLLMDIRKDSVEEIAIEYMDGFMVPEAAEITQNRIGIWDQSGLGAIPSWYFSKDMDENSVLYSYGWAYQGAKTMDNIVSINEAIEKGYFEYAFDRTLELGDDTIVVEKSWINDNYINSMKNAAITVGYDLILENDKVWVYHFPNVNGTFGISKQYKNLTIGKQAQSICYIYPQFGAGTSIYLDDYTVDDLIKYSKIYISGFDYHNKEKAEALLQAVSAYGTKVYIDMQHIPLDKESGKAEFLGVYAQHVSFTEKFPVLNTQNGETFKLDLETGGYEVWNTVYLTGASERLKEAYYDETTDLTYLARNGHNNIYFLGLNPVYYYLESEIPLLLQFLNETFEEEPRQICVSNIIPISVEYQPNQVVVYSDYSNVNTGISNLDCFVLPQGMKKSQHNLLVVDEGETIFHVVYTNLIVGLLVSTLGFVLSVSYWILMIKRQKWEGTR